MKTNTVLLLKNSEYFELEDTHVLVCNPRGKLIQKYTCELRESFVALKIFKKQQNIEKKLH